MYTDKVYEHFMCPQNAHSIPNADGEGTFGDRSCGDSLTMYIKVENNILTDVGYLVFGCPASVATSSMTSVLAKGRTIGQALTLTDEDIEQALDGLPESKRHCSNLGVSALNLAIENYFERKNTL